MRKKRCSLKKLFLEISQNSQENTCSRVYFLNKVTDLRLNKGLIFPANNYLFNVSNRNTRKSCEIYSKLTRKTPERRH